MKRRQVMGRAEITRALNRIAREVLRAQRGAVGDLALVGIKRRGAPLAHRLAAAIGRLSRRPIPVGALDINLYRDDVQLAADAPVVRGSEIPFDLNGRVIILVDDVLFTGRTVRAALTEFQDYGRPRAVRLAVLIDRGGRELPICADFVGKTLRTAARDIVEIRVREQDGSDGVYLTKDPAP